MTLLEQIQYHLAKLPPEQQQEVLDFVSFLQQRQRDLSTPTAVAGRGQRIKDSLTQLSKMKVFTDITDPVAWQRQIRQDRPLPGRDA